VLPPLLFVSYFAFGNIVTLALVGDGAAVVTFRRWRRDPGVGLRAVLPVLAQAIVHYVVVGFAHVL
jgi:hypothetical protein